MEREQVSTPTPALFIGNLGMGKKEFFFQVFQCRVIEVELSFERAIGHALTTPEQVNDLVEQGIKVHRALPSTTREGMSLNNGTSYQSPAASSTERCIASTDQRRGDGRDRPIPVVVARHEPTHLQRYPSA